MGIENLIFDENIAVNSKLMEFAMERQRVIANNIANAETPGYSRLELDFQKQLTELIEDNQHDKIQDLEAKVVQDRKSEYNMEGNNVVISKEMNDMMQNSIFYNLLTKAFNMKMSILRNSITSH